jgi:uncharacterized protein (DUF1778 family)
MTVMTKVQIRVEKEQVALWKEAARLRRVSLSEWMRKVLDATASETVEEDK